MVKRRSAERPVIKLKTQSQRHLTPFKPLAGDADEGEEMLGEEEEGITPELAKCVSESLGTVSQEEAEMIVFEMSLEPLEEAAGGRE
jgi:hypothetical protein